MKHCSIDHYDSVRGSNNYNWKGCISEYSRQRQMQRMSNLVLEEQKYICQTCGKRAKLVHHIDKSKSNHSRENLIALCPHCHFTIFHKTGKPKNRISRFEIMSCLNCFNYKFFKTKKILKCKVGFWLNGNGKEKIIKLNDFEQKTHHEETEPVMPRKLFQQAKKCSHFNK